MLNESTRKISFNWASTLIYNIPIKNFIHTGRFAMSIINHTKQHFHFLERIRWREKTSFSRRQIESKQIDHPPLSHRILVYIWNRRLFSPRQHFAVGDAPTKSWITGVVSAVVKEGERARDKEKKEGNAGERNLRRRLSWMGPIVNYSARLEG